jgi:pyruvate kinase
MITRTKIVCTIGPAVIEYEKMVDLLKAGMNVARLNFSHGTYHEHARNIQNLKKGRKATKLPLALMLDLQGPKIRIGKVQNGELTLSSKQRIRLVEKGIGDAKSIPFQPFVVIEALKVGMKILFDDGYIIGRVLEVGPKYAEIEIENAGILKSNKGVSIPGAIIPLPALTEKDFADLKFGCEQKVDLIAASFIRSSSHIHAIRKYLLELGAQIPIIAKIESTQGVENFDSIVQTADGIMVARGDLGVELDLATVPKLQKMMIRKCYYACKPVITATQMLESMIHHPRPTRAEVSDVANAIYDGTSMVMLSAETAVGKYPIETVRLMKHIADVTEKDIDYETFFNQHSTKNDHDISTSVSLAAVKTAYSAKAKAIFAFTASGTTAQFLSRFRPSMPIIAVTTNEQTYHQLSAIWGVVPLFSPSCKTAQDAFVAATRFAIKKKIITLGDVVVVTSGAPFDQKGSTNMMIVQSIGNILARGLSGIGPKVSGKIHLLLSSSDAKASHLKNKIVVITHCDNTYGALLKHCKGIILQSCIGDTASEKYAIALAKNLKIPILTRVDGATRLSPNEEITMDPKKGLIFKDSFVI